MKLTLCLREQLVSADNRLQAFLFSVHDWLAFFSGDLYQWLPYGSSLVEVISERTANIPQTSKLWSTSVIGHPMTSHTLLYRHYLLSQVIDAGIDLNVNFPYLYQLMASSLLDEVVFTHLSSTHLWEGIDTDSYPINRLRQKQPVLKDYLYALSMQEHTHPDQLITDHGEMFSLSLLYGLYLVQVILVYEATVTPNPVLLTIIDGLRDALITLKGEICYGSYDWHEADVR